VEVDFMIFGSFRTLETDRRILPAALVRGLDYLRDTDFSRVESGRVEIDGDAIFAVVEEYRTAPKGEKLPEAHRKYVDIQYVAQGSEIIGCALENPSDEIAEDRLAGEDLLFYRTVQNEMELILIPGSYLILFPQDVHRPGCRCGDGDRVKKVVVKVRRDLL
jgi:biofilm protein TabA